MFFHRFTRILLLAGTCVVLWALPLAAQDANGGHKSPHDQANNFLNAADLAVLATVTNVVLPKDPGAKVGNTGVNLTYAQVTMKIDKAFIGKYSAGETVTLPIQCMQANTQDGLRWVPDIQANTQTLFALKRDKSGYALTVPGATAMSPAANLPQWDAALAALPLRISAPKIDGPVAFGENAAGERLKTTITVTLKNPLDQPINITYLNFTGFFLSKKLGNYLSLYPGTDEVPNAAKPLLLEAKSEKVVTVHVTSAAPDAWGLFEPDCMLVTPVAIRVIAHVARIPEAAGRNGAETYNSPLTLTTAGFTQAKFD